ncbi:MAG: PLP-dependent transferase [Desulfobacteraceae bacterium]|nr:PLP-dependent transferase [Desulfobacteraceae bacterium]
MKKQTRCIHSGTHMDPATGGVNTPIYTSSAFHYIDSGDQPYPRYFNIPNQKTVVEKLAALEKTPTGMVFSSGMAAISTLVITLMKSGDHAVLMDDMYGGTHAFVTDLFERLGMKHTFADTDPAAVAAAVRDNTSLIYIESPTNPLLNVIDIQKIARIGKETGITTAIDNTFASPVNQNPYELGIDAVIHSGTKYLGGHSDLCCGAVLADEELSARIHRTAAHLGGSLNAQTCYLLERSLKTLYIRVAQQSRNALDLSRYLSTHGAIDRVYYPGLETHPGYDIARRQMSGFGGMLSFEINESKMTNAGFMRALRLIKPAMSLGGVESTICAPALTSHKKISREAREKLGIRDNLLRLSVGIEHIDDLTADLEQALAD